MEMTNESAIWILKLLRDQRPPFRKSHPVNNLDVNSALDIAITAISRQDRQFTSTGSGESEFAIDAVVPEVAALKGLIEYCSARQSSFHSLDHGAWSLRMPAESSADLIGRWDKNDGAGFIGILRPRFNSIVTQMGFRPLDVLRAWKLRGWIEMDGRNFAPYVRLRHGSFRMIKIFRAAVEAAI